MTIHPPRPVKKRPPRVTREAAKRAAVPQKQPTPRRNKVIIAVASVLVVAIIAGLGTYFGLVAPYQRVILSVGSQSVKTGYFLKRVVASQTQDPATMMQQLEAEMVILQTAPQYGIPLPTAQEVDDYLRNAATTQKGLSEPISDADYAAWLKNELNNTGLTQAEYRDVASREVLWNKLAGVVGAGVQNVVPQVHLWVIATSTSDAATAAKARIDGGEAFADVAKEVSMNSTAATDGGDMGWVPPELLSSQLSPTVDSLDIGKCSDPVPYASTDSYGTPTTSFFLFMVTEKSAAKEVTDAQLTMLKNKAMSDWLQNQISTTQVTVYLRNGKGTALDTETTAWINYEVQKLIKKRPSTTTTETATTTTEPTTTTPATTEPGTTAPTTESTTEPATSSTTTP